MKCKYRNDVEKLYDLIMSKILFNGLFGIIQAGYLDMLMQSLNTWRRDPKSIDADYRGETTAKMFALISFILTTTMPFVYFIVVLVHNNSFFETKFKNFYNLLFKSLKHNHMTSEGYTRLKNKALRDKKDEAVKTSAFMLIAA